jgi:predicted phage baseplate assembly protein
VAVNALTFRHAAAAGAVPATLGVSDGTAGQAYRLRSGPVVADSTRIVLTTGGQADDRWREVPEWDRSGPADRHYRLAPESGTVSFGDGRVGLVPPAGAGILARAYRVGGGEWGNLPAGRLTRMVGPAGRDLHPVQLHPAAGGAAAEPLAAAHGRALRELARASRAVTAADCEELALATPGLPVARARALPGHHPSFPCIQVAGAVTVVVLPACGSPPTPSPGFLRAVRQYLERRRPLATELLVTGPEYVRVGVAARLQVTAGAEAGDLAGRAGAALDGFLDPLRGGGDGTGWPFGRAVLETDVLALLSSLPGVRAVDQVAFWTGEGPGSRCGAVAVCPTGLVAPAAHRITVVEEEPG